MWLLKVEWGTLPDGGQAGNEERGFWIIGQFKFVFYILLRSTPTKGGQARRTGKIEIS